MPSIESVLTAMLSLPFSCASAVPEALSVVPSSFAGMTSAGLALRPAPLGSHPKSLRALVTTNTDEKPMAAAPIIGFRLTPQGESTPMATGMQIEL